MLNKKVAWNESGNKKSGLHYHYTTGDVMFSVGRSLIDACYKLLCYKEGDITFISSKDE